MARYDRTVEWDKGGIHYYKILGSPDIYAVQYYDSGHVIKTAEKWGKPTYLYKGAKRILVSPSESYNSDKFKEEFHYDCGIPNHKNCTRRFPLNDIREMDLEAKFGMPERKELRQLM